MSDGSVKIKVISDDQQALDTLELLKSIEKEITTMNNKMGGKDPMKPLSDSTSKAKSGVLDMTKALIGTKVVTTVFSTIAGSIDKAISRFDTMQQYPRMMEQIGFSSEQSERSIRKLSTGIEGLPTRLDEVVGTAQGLAVMTGDINKATDLTLALNNAFLASGSSSADASRGLIQYQQMLANGKVDMQSWRTLNETMGIGLMKTAEAFGFAGQSAKSDLYDALKGGTITFNEFSDKLIELNDGVGGFAEMASVGSKGIATSMQNIKTAVVNGVANVIQEFANLTKNVTGLEIYEILDIIKVKIRDTFAIIVNAIKVTQPIISVVVKSIIGLTDALINALPLITAFAVAIGTMTAIAKVGVALKALEFNFILMQAYVAKGTIALKAFWATLISNPLGWVGIAIGAVAGALYGVYKRLSRVNPEVEALSNTMSDAGQKSQELADSISESAENYETQKDSIKATSEAMDGLAESTLDLANNQNRTGTQTKELKDQINQLNDYIGESVVSLNEQTGQLNLSQEALDAYLEVAKGEKELEAVKARIIELDNEQANIQKQKTENSEALAEAQAKLAEADWHEIGNKKELNKSIEELTEKQTLLSEKETEYTDKKTELTEQQKTLNGELQASNETLTAVMDDQASRRISSIEELNEKEQEVAELMKQRYSDIADAATDMFDRINTESKLSVEEMIENLQHNAEAVSNWADNLDILAERGINQGILAKLEAMGPEGAGYVAELVTASDEQLLRLNEAFNVGGETAKNSLMQSMNVTSEDLPNGLMEIVTVAEQTLSDQVNNVGWSKMGDNIVQGVVDGVESKGEFASQAMRKMAEIMDQEFRIRNEIQSPSKLYQRHAQNMMDGVVNGIKARMQNAITVMGETAKNIANNAVNRFKEAQSQASYAGKMFGNGFVSGLQSTAGAIMSKARSLASSAYNTIKKALKIHSPSKATFELGEFTGEGFGDGVISQVKSVKDKAKELSQATLNAIKPDKLFDVTGHSKANSIYNNNKNNNTNVNIQRIEWTGKEDIRKTMNEIGWLTGQEEWRLSET